MNATKLYGIEFAVDAGRGRFFSFFVYHVVTELVIECRSKQQTIDAAIGPLRNELHIKPFARNSPRFPLKRQTVQFTDFSLLS